MDRVSSQSVVRRGLLPRRAAVITALVILGVLIVAGDAAAIASGRLVWQRRVGTSASEAGFYAVATGPGGVVAVAGDKDTAAGEAVFVTAYSSRGVKKWARTLGSLTGYAVAAAYDRGGNLFVAARVQGDDEDVALIKFSRSGRVMWTKMYTGATGERNEVMRVAVDSSGSVIVAGTNSGSGYKSGVFVLKYSNAGAKKWWTRYDPDPADPLAGNRVCNDLALDGSGNAYVTGVSFYDISGRSVGSAMTIRFAASSGTVTWARLYAGENDSNVGAEASSIAIRGANLVVGGVARISVPGWVDAFVLKYSLGGVLRAGDEWLAGNSMDEWIHDVAIDSRGNVIGAGYQYGETPDYFDKALVVKFSPTLARAIWNKTYAPANPTAEAHHVLVDGADNIYAGGYRYDGDGYEDFLAIKYRSGGARAWLKTWSCGGPDDDEIQGMALGATEGLYLAGVGTAKGDFSQGVLLKYQR